MPRTRAMAEGAFFARCSIRRVAVTSEDVDAAFLLVWFLGLNEVHRGINEGHAMRLAVLGVSAGNRPPARFKVHISPSHARATACAASRETPCWAPQMGTWLPVLGYLSPLSEDQALDGAVSGEGQGAGGGAIHH
jgi:hypothetical protein